MNQDVVNAINHLRVERAELKVELKNVEFDEERADEKEEIEQDIAALDNEILQLGTHLKDEDYVIEEAVYDEEEYEDEELEEEPQEEEE